ncbi:SRPBCC family protein [Pseudonocardia abyssalis]|uniref:SRPBCC family protein n=1 Tax=Pseudonocardia abyssalis TaxID=2792008 RepID=UPI001C49F8B6|nr:SRPBCC family protein [Pseudonocardia abyssalis]MBW0117116.1 SRPBCC family protein [Pseudonocardia abyssalis]
MQLENKFTIEAPIEKAWVALNTPDMIAPCFPGATLTEYEGESFSGTVKVKLGPISLTYKGKGTYIDRDDANHTVKIEASGRDSRGNGTANATVTGTMVADGPNKTAVTMVTDMTITGRPAQFGRGAVRAGRGPALSSTPASSGVTATAPAARQFTPMKSEIDAIDLLDTAGSPVLKRLAPVLGGGALLFLIVFLIRRARA